MLSEIKPATPTFNSQLSFYQTSFTPCRLVEEFNSVQSQINRHEVQNNKILKKYKQFMTNQNQILTKIVLRSPSQEKNKNKQKECIKSCLQQEIINKLRDQSNQFIKSLLNELTEVYSKLRCSKLGSQQKIYLLEKQFLKQRQLGRKRQIQFKTEYQQKHKQTQKYIDLIEKELQDTIQKYQHKLTTFLEELSKKQRQIVHLTQHNKQLQGKISQNTRILRLEQEKINHKNKQFKGMELLILEYESTLEQKEKLLAQTNSLLNIYKKQITQAQSSNKDLLIKIDRFEDQNQGYRQEIAKLKQDLEQSRSESRKNNEKLQGQIINLQKRLVCSQKNEQILKQKLLKISEEVIKSTQIISKKNGQYKDIKTNAKNAITKIQEMFCSRERLLKKSYISQVNRVRKSHDQLKKYIKKQLERFNQQVRMDLILNQINSNISIKTVFNNKEKENAEEIIAKSQYQCENSPIYFVQI